MPHTEGSNPRVSRQGPRQVVFCYSHVPEPRLGQTARGGEASRAGRGARASQRRCCGRPRLSLSLSLSLTPNPGPNPNPNPGAAGRGRHRPSGRHGRHPGRDDWEGCGVWGSGLQGPAGEL
eukprot:scaffold29502_cov31-Phaeocystis_antarctica.AAC.2